MKHTPGPWYCDAKSGDVKSRDNKFICNPEGYGVVKGENRHGDAEEALANSHLIAAAPELFEAIKGLLSPDPQPHDFDKARDAIAKADGSLSQAA